MKKIFRKLKIYDTVSEKVTDNLIDVQKGSNMANTATLNIYRLRDDVDIVTLQDHIVTAKGYQCLALRADLGDDYAVHAYQKESRNTPDFFKFIEPVIEDPTQFHFCKYNFIFIFEGAENVFIITSGSAYHLVDLFAELDFGIRVLERVFDEDKNKLDSIKEKGIIGDVLASSRFYRKARALAYEDDFGKYFQNINIKLTVEQVVTHFPSISKGRDLTIAGASSVSLKSKVSFENFWELLKELEVVLDLPKKPIFNQSLIPLDKRKGKEMIEALNKQVFFSMKRKSSDISLKYDFCHRNFEEFFSSTKAVFTFLDNCVEVDDMHRLSDFAFLDDVNNRLDDSISDEAYIQAISSIGVETFDDNEHILTKGNLIDYVQTELQYDSRSYFLMDGFWYQIESKFDKNLAEKYSGRVIDKVQHQPFLLSWKEGDDETAYNEQHKDIDNTYYLHCVLVDHIELCDVLHYDKDNDKVYVIHVKKGLSNSMRDLVSQVILSAKIIEEEKLVTEDKMLKLAELYEKAVNKSRIDEATITKYEFLQLFKNNRVEYCLAILDDTSSIGRLQSGEFGSRIAKFSLVELASVMSANQWAFSIHEIDKC